MVDVDDFKAYNDRYGHEGGDKGVYVCISLVCPSCDSSVAAILPPNRLLQNSLPCSASRLQQIFCRELEGVMNCWKR
jgi:hypothetical protein